MKKVLWLIAIVALAVAAGCSTSSPGDRAPRSNSPKLSTGTMDDWIASVCRFQRYAGDLPVPRWICKGFPEGEFGTLLFVSRFSSQAEMLAHPEQWSGRYSYASCTSGDGSVTVFVSDVSGIGSKGAAVQLTGQSLQPLTEFGCIITEANPYQSPPAAQRTSQPQPAPLTPAWTPASPAPASTLASPAPSSAQPSLADADLQGFLNFPGARCNYTNPAVVIAKTSDSLVVICQTGVGRHYYRGFGLQNGLSVEIDDPVRNGAGFVATNNGVQYSVAPDALLITQDSTVLSHEPMLEYWSG